MNCEEARTLWHARFDDSGDANSDHNAEPAAHFELDAHIALCESCRDYDAEMLLIVCALDELGAEAVPAYDAVTPMRLVSQKSWRLLGMAAMIALVAGGAWWVTILMPQQGAERRGKYTADGTVIESPTGPRSGGNDRVGLSLRGKSAGEYLALRRPTPVANVQLYWLYPMVATNDRRGGTADGRTP